MSGSSSPLPKSLFPTRPPWEDIPSHHRGNGLCGHTMKTGGRLAYLVSLAIKQEPDKPHASQEQVCRDFLCRSWDMVSERPQSATGLL